MLTKIRIQNFKSFKDVEVELGVTNVLVGPNMSGKSNFLDVFRFFVDVLVPAPGMQALSNAFFKRNGFQEVAWKGQDSSNVIAFTLDGNFVDDKTNEYTNWRYQLDLVGERRFGNVNVQREELILFVPNGPLHLVSTGQGVRTINATGRSGPFQVQDSTRLALEYELPDWEGNRIRASILSWHFYRLLPPLMRQANPSAITQVLTEHGENLASWLLLLQTRHGDHFQRIVNVCRSVFPGLLDLLSWPTQQSTVYVASREKYLTSPTTVWQMSDGELAFIALLSLIFAPTGLGGSMYCVEEPENYLHPRLLTVLTELLRQAQMELKPTDLSQLIISTHSPHLIDKYSIDDLILFHREEGATACTRPRDNDQFRKLVESGEIGLGDLYYSGALARA